MLILLGEDYLAWLCPNQMSGPSLDSLQPHPLARAAWTGFLCFTIAHSLSCRLPGHPLVIPGTPRVV